jgi:hypothetical protein
MIEIAMLLYFPLVKIGETHRHYPKNARKKIDHTAGRAYILSILLQKG